MPPSLQHANCLDIENSIHELPPLAVQPLQPIRIAFESRASTPAFWVINFFDADGERIYSDCHSLIEPSQDWQPQVSYVTARETAVTIRLGFVRPSEAPLQVRNIALSPAGAAEVLQWMDDMAGALPPLNVSVPDSRWERFPETRRKLAAGETLRMVVLGDSVANDMMNSQCHLLIQRAWPGSTVVPVHSMEQEKTSANYAGGDCVERFVVARRPDLLVLAGSSHGHDPQHIRTIVRRARAAGIREILAAPAVVAQNTIGNMGPYRRFVDALRQAGAEDGFPVYDICSAFVDTVEAAGLDPETLRRDHCHANDRGKQLLGRIFAAYFMP